jgi:hypothetical protein
MHATYEIATQPALAEGCDGAVVRVSVITHTSLAAVRGFVDLMHRAFLLALLAMTQVACALVPAAGLRQLGHGASGRDFTAQSWKPVHRRRPVIKKPLSLQAGTAESDPDAEARRAAYMRDREVREQLLLPKRVNMEAFFNEDVCPDYIERWGGMHRQVAMEGPTRMALEMAVDSEWAVDSWTVSPTATETEGVPTRTVL